MTMDEKLKIAKTARKLIWLLNTCDDDEFVDEVLQCVQDGDGLMLEPNYL